MFTGRVEGTVNTGEVVRDLNNATRVDLIKFGERPREEELC